uniref:EF-hand domain-containing protein n=1 Tax=Noctiluca scintillans TaxID=2966 RepID=A0A7S1FCC5_NOCSC|mmetsp:Transcript_49417/g.131166  ORF Transcript_49417/g.131166 Transcript_49417/m.131166 type:complete len:248 (+) Transcript_49417:67-810(+)
MMSVTRNAFLSLFAIVRVQANVNSFLGFASHETPMEDARRSLESLDANHDHHVSREEVKAFAKSMGEFGTDADKQFSDLDANSDGELDVYEISNALTQETQTAKEVSTQGPFMIVPKSAPGEFTVVPMGSVPGVKTELMSDDAQQTAAAESSAALLASDLAEAAKAASTAAALEREAAQLRSVVATEAKAFATGHGDPKERVEKFIKMEMEAQEKEEQAAAARARYTALRRQSRDLMTVTKSLLSED